jgi:hypothetical protein
MNLTTPIHTPQIHTPQILIPHFEDKKIKVFGGQRPGSCSKESSKIKP